MKILDRYLLRQFVRTFFICFLSLTGLYIVFDVFTNLDDFLRTAERTGGLTSLLGHYYLYRSILFFDRTSALLVLVSAMFTVAWIQRHNELTALMAAGISRIRVVKPIVIAAIVLSVFATGVREVVIPRCVMEFLRTPRDLIGDKAQDMTPRYDNQTDVFFSGAKTFVGDRRIEEPNFRLPEALARHGERLTAENAYYRDPGGGMPGGYLLKGVREPKNIDQLESLDLNGKMVVVTRRDAPQWLAPGECFLISDLGFEQLIGGGQGVRQFSSTYQLIRGLHNKSLDFGADVRVIIHSRIVQPFLDVTLLFLGLPLVLTRHSRNVFLAIGLCVVLVCVFLLVQIGCQAMGNNLLLTPALAAWIPVMVFVPMAVGMYETLRL